MQSKGAIKLLAVLLALACVYQLSFTFKTRSVEKKASEYAAQFPLDQQGEAEQHYLDSVQNLGVYNLGFKKFTYKECKEKELNLGLDLKGGMNVMLEVQVEDVVKALAGDSQNDPAFVGAIAEANAALKDGTSKDYISDFVKAYQRLSNGGSLAAIFVSPDRKDITLESSDADVEKILKKETDAAIAASFNVLRSRIDHFGVTQPNIMRLPNSHRILVELPGVKEPQRVRDLLQGTASLEFWLTYDAREVLPALAAADKLVKAELAELPAATQPETASAEAEAVGEQTASGDAAGLIAEIGADSVAAAGQVDAGRYDLVCNGVEVTEERAKTYDFTTPYGYIHTALAVSKDNEDIKSFEDLAGKTTANSLASTYMELAESYGATVQGIDTLEETIQLLTAGRIDATLNANVSFYDYLNVHPDADFKLVAQTEDASHVAIPIVKSDDSSFLDALNSAIDELRADGTLKELGEKYFGQDISSEN